MKLLILFGPPSVGKTTVGKIIEKRTGFKLFHNHMVMDGVMHLFGVGTPAENRLSRKIRSEVIREAADAELDLIFTYVWNFASDKGKSNIDMYKKIYEDRGGEVIFVELTAPLKVRKSRAEHQDRHRIKAYAPDAKTVVELEAKLGLQSPEPFYYPDAYHRVNTANKIPEQVAREVAAIIK